MAVRSAVPSDLFPLVFSFLRENKLLSVAREFTKATGVKDQDPNAASLLDIFNNWLSSSAAKKRKLRSNGPSVTKKNKKDLSSSYDSSSEDGEPVVKRSEGKSPTIAQKASNGKASESSSSSNSSDYEGSSSEKKNPAKKMQPLNSAVVKPAAYTSKIPFTKGLLTRVKASSTSDDSSDSLEDEKTPIKSKSKSGNAPLTKLLVKENNALKKVESSSDSNCDSSSEDYESKSKFSSKSLQAKALVKAVPRKLSRPKNISSSSDEGTESHSSEVETLEKTRAKASTSKSLVTKAKSSLSSTKRVKRTSGSNSSLSESEVKKKATSGKLPPKGSLPCPEQVFLLEKKVLAASKDSSSDSDASSSYKDDTCNTAMKHKAVAHGKSPASIAGTSSTVLVKSILQKKGPAGSSTISDSSGEEEQKSKKAVPAEQANLNSAKKAKISSSDSSSEFKTEQEKKSVLFTSSQRTTAVISTKKKAKSVSEKGSTNTHSTATLKTKVPEKNEESSEESSSSEEQEVTGELFHLLSTGKSLKKWKTDISSGSQNCIERTSDLKALAQTPNTFLKVKAKKSQSAEPFRRVRDEEIEVDCRVGNNSFDAKRGAKGDWGEKANNVLKFTKGKSFRHEKTKKKRGNYCGGEISTSIKSIKFDSE